MATNITESGFYFGRCPTVEQASNTRRQWGLPLSRYGRRLKWSEAYAARCLDAGGIVEKAQQITRPHPHPDWDGETLTEWVIVDTLCACPDCGAHVSATEAEPRGVWFDCRCGMAGQFDR